MQPSDYNQQPQPSPQQSTVQDRPQVVPPMQATQPPMMQENTPNKGLNKKVVYIALAVVGLLLLIAVLTIVLLSGDEPEPTVQQPAAVPSGTVPASGSSIEQINNAISQDVSAIDDADDFPEDQLSDDVLDL